jgi:hypothetical protein
MSPEAKAAKRAKFALECRKIRLFLAEHPGATSPEIKQATGISPRFHLAKMVGMGIVRWDGENFGTPPMRQQWYVVPQ